MQLSFLKTTALLTAALLATPVFAASNVRRSSSTTSSTHRSAALSTAKSTKTTKSSKSAKSGKTSTAASRRSARSRRPKGQQSIDSERVTQIQQALIREHYMTGDPTGSWDATTVSAMQKFQADQGWQTKLMPDSRAIKKLGLGPDYSTAINAKDSTFADPPPVTTIPAPQNAGFASAAGVSQ